MIIAGAHHDTVYQGQGAVDDSSGVATVLEMARQLPISLPNRTSPRTIRFCTWGGEEEGLWGSRAYVADMQSNLREITSDCVSKYDMNHVDADFQERGNSLTLFTNNAMIMDILTELQICTMRKSGANKYDIRFGLLDGDEDANEMPCNSDYCPFIYELGWQNR